MAFARVAEHLGGGQRHHRRSRLPPEEIRWLAICGINLDVEPAWTDQLR